MKFKKGLSLVLSLILAAQLCLPVGVLAADANATDPGAGEIVCTHHNQHTAECGYTAEGAVCTFDPATCKECNPQPAAPAEPTKPEVPVVPAEPAAPKAKLVAAEPGHIDISGVDGHIVIEDNGYTIGVGSKVSYTGPYVLTGSTTETNAPVTGEFQNFTKNSHIAVKNTTSTPIEITLNDVDIQFANIDERPLCPFSIDAGAVNLTLLGSNKLTGSYLAPGLCVEKGASLTVTNQSTGSLTAISVNSSMDFYNGAGIGGRTTNGGSITILGGTVSATGSASEALYGEPGPGISGSNVTISGGSVTAIGGDNSSGHDQLDIGIGGSFSANGNAVIFASSIKDQTQKSNWHGIIFEGAKGFLYGNYVTLNTNVTIPSGKTLLVAAGQALTISDGITVTNNGLIILDPTGTIKGNVTGNRPGTGVIDIDITDPTRYITITNTGYKIGEAAETLYEGAYRLTSTSLVTTARTHISVNNSAETTIDITLKDMKITSDGCPFSIDHGFVNLTLEGKNVLKGGSGSPGLRVEYGRRLTITNQSTGSLTAVGGNQGAGIGGGSGASFGSGEITINGGVVTANGGNQCAGIGGSFFANGAAAIIASSISDWDHSNTWKGLICDGSSGGIYGTDHFTLPGDVTIPSGYILNMKTGQTLTVPAGITLTVDGRIYTHGGTVEKLGTIVRPENIMPTMPIVDISKGNVIIGSSPLGTPCEPPCQGHVIAGTTDKYNISVWGGTHNITLLGVDIQNNYDTSAFALFNGATVNLTLVGTNTLLGDSYYAGLAVREGNTLTITADSTGTLNATGGKYGAGIGGDYGGGEICQTGTININGGTVNATGGYEGAGIGGGYYCSGGSININGGTVTAKALDYGAGIGGGIYGTGGYISITGGVVNATCDQYGAGIGGGYKSDSGHINIYGGKVTASSGGITDYGGAGIGCGEKAPNNKADNYITIRGGDVTATGGVGGAGIGGCYNVGAGYILIAGGKVNAKGGNAHLDNGAGIGGGVYGKGGDVNITGGDVTATGGKTGAGIGYGHRGQDITINISGGTVVARGGESGAGIGSGFTSKGGDIVNITGGTVTATGGKDSAGIGSGCSSTGGKVTITGGTVTATGDNYGSGVGGGLGTTGNTVTIDGDTVVFAKRGSSNADHIGNGSDGFGKLGTTAVVNRTHGIAFEGDNGSFYGSDVTLWDNTTLPSGKNLTIPVGKTLIIPDGKALTNDGTLFLDGGRIMGAGNLNGNGVFKVSMVSGDIADIPDQVYTGKAIEPLVTLNHRNIFGKDFTVVADGFAKGYENNINVGTTAKVVYTRSGYQTVEKDFNIVKSGTAFDGSIKVYNGTTETTSFIYGDTITVKAKPIPTGVVALMAVPAENQMALYRGNTQISDPASPDNSGVYTMTYNTTGNALALGNNAITARYIGTSSMADTFGDVSVTLRAKVLTATITGDRMEKVYDGTVDFFNIPLTLTGLASDDAVTATANAAAFTANAGTRAFTASAIKLDGASAGYYTLAPADVSGNVTITPATPTVKLKAEETDGGLLLTATTGGVNNEAPNGTVVFTYGSDGKTVLATVSAVDGVASFLWDNPPAGKQTITANFGASSGNYKSDVVKATATATVGEQNQAPLAITPVANKTYGDGSFALSTTGGNGSGAVSYRVTSGDALTVSGNTATIVGTGKVTVTATKAEDSNYKPATSAPITITIGAKPVTVTVTAQNKVYDGNNTANVSYIVSGTVGKDELTATGTAAFDTKAAGNGKTVTATGIAISGTKVGNYTLTKNTATTKASITQKPLTWGAGGKVNSKEYDGGTSATVATNPILIGVFSSDTVSVTNGTVAFAGANVGTHAITATGFGIEGIDSANYTAPVGQPVFANGSIAVKNITPTVTVSGSYTFNGKPQIPTITVKTGTTVIPDTNYTVTYGTNINVKTGGSVTVTLNGNYSGGAYKTFAIGKAATSSSTVTQPILMRANEIHTIPLPAISNAGEVKYSVSAPTGAAIFSQAPTVAGGNLQFTCATGAATGAKATVVITIKSDNYKDFTVTQTFEVTAKESVKIDGLTAKSATYNGQPHSGYAGTIAVEGNKVPAADLVYTYTGIGVTKYAPSDTAPTNAGSYKLTIAVPDSNNAYTGSHAVITFVITKALITVEPGNYTVNKVWDGNTTATATGKLTVIGGVNGETVTVAATPHDYPSADVSDNYSVTVDLALTDTSGNYVLENSTITVIGAITKATVLPNPPAAPTVMTKSDTSITLKPVTVYGETVEYAMSETTTPSIWQDSTTFGGLVANTQYYFFARVKASTNHGAGVTSSGTAITTAKKAFEKTEFTTDEGVTITGAELLLEPTSFRITNGYVWNSYLTAKNMFGTCIPDDAIISAITPPEQMQVLASVAIESGKLVFTSKKNDLGITATDTVSITICSSAYQDFNHSVIFYASEKANATITATLNGKTYDGTPVEQPTPSATGDGLNIKTLTYTYQWKQGDTVLDAAPSNAGDYTLVINGSNKSYAGSLTIPFTIDKKPLTVTAGDTAVISGDTPTFTNTPVGLVLGETLTAVAYNCSYDKSKPDAGMARTAIIPHGGTVSSGSGNYAISYVPGTLTINPDKNALSAAIAAAEALKSSVERLDKAPAEVESGKRFVTSNVMTALESAITGAKQVAETAMTPQEIADAMTALTSATEAFVAAIQTGSYSYDSVDWGTYPKPSKPSADRFIDIKGHWAETSIRFVVEESLFNGISHTLFAPDMNMTRGMLVTVLYRQAGSPTVEASGSEWYSSARAWAMQTAISDGTSMDDAITRQELVTMLHRYAKHIGIDVSIGDDTNILSYNDAFDLPQWSIPAFQWSCGADIIKGTNENLLPASLATRAEVATMLQRFVGLKAAKV